MVIFRRAVRQLWQHGRAFLLINLAYFGLVCGGMAYGAYDQLSHDAYEAQVRRQAADTLPTVFAAYQGGHVVQAIGLTFLINLLLGSVLAITLTSFGIPFSGLLVGAVRAFTWGFIFSPSYATLDGMALIYGLLVGLVLFLEGEGYILAMLGSYLHGKQFLLPGTAGLATRWQGYKRGMQTTAQLYPLVAGALLVAATYEALAVIYLLPLVR